MSQETHKPILGLIGGIGSGKSLVAGELTKHGGFLISGDLLGHEALRQPDIGQQVLERFGKEIADDKGTIDRRRLGARVFANQEELRALEDLVFPYIERRIGEEIDRARHMDQVSFIVLDAAIMLETGWGRVCDKLIFVDAPRAVRLERLARKHGWSEKEVTAREKMQLELTAKKVRADIVVDNGQSAASVPNQVREVLQRLGLTARSV